MNGTAVTFLSPREAAQLLRVSERSIRRWVAAGLIRAKRVGRQIRIPRETLEEVGTSWPALARDAFGRDWDNPQDAVYDDWKRRYHV